jgi:hypothetical protein
MADADGRSCSQAHATTIRTWSDNSTDESGFEINNGDESRSISADSDYFERTV